MQIVTFPPQLVDAYVSDVRRILETGQVAEGRYFHDAAGEYVPGRLSLPVASGGAAIFALLAYHRHAAGRSVAIVQSNTMRALYTVPTLAGLRPVVVDSSYDDFLAMSPDRLAEALEDGTMRREAVVVYSVIGGYLAPSFARIADICRHAGVPLVVDAAHAHYLDGIVKDPIADVAYSFYATKILPAGEGGLVCTARPEVYDWIRRFSIYDRFDNRLAVGLNLRANELTAALMHRLMTESQWAAYFRDARVEIAGRYAALCKEQGIRFLDPTGAAEYNGYKLVVLDPFEDVARLATPLTAHTPTSAVFATDVRGGPTALPHWCPPTYPSLAPTSRRTP